MFSIPFKIKRSINISKPTSEVFNSIADFSNWPTWSPWLKQEKNCAVDLSGNAKTEGHHQSWDGKAIGKGNMTLKTITENKALQYDLNFLKPWKSKSKVEFLFNETPEGTEVTWTMEGSLPFFLFFMKKFMQAFVGQDYERGLSMLKSYLETDTVLTDTEVTGITEKKGFYYLGIHRKSTIKEMPTLMSEDFKTLFQKLEKGELKDPDQMLSFYHKFDFASGTCEFTSAFAYWEKPQAVEGFQGGEVKDHKVFQTVHTGAYDYLGNAWMSAMSHQRSQKLKMNKAVSNYEVYLYNPENTPVEKQKVEVNVPIK